MTQAKDVNNENFDVEVNVNPPSQGLSDVSKTNISVEEFRISSDTLIPTVQELIHQSTIRRIIIKTEDGYTLLEVPLPIGILGGSLGFSFFLPIAVVGTVGAVVTRLRIVVERSER